MMGWILQLKNYVVSPGGNNISVNYNIYNLLNGDLPNLPLTEKARYTRISGGLRTIEGVYGLSFNPAVGTGLGIYCYSYVGPNLSDGQPLWYAAVAAGTSSVYGKFNFGLRGYVRIWSNESSDITITKGIFVFPGDF